MTSTLPGDSGRLTHFLMTPRRGSFESYYLQPESHCSGKTKVGGVQTTVGICVCLPLAALQRHRFLDGIRTEAW